MVWSFEPRGTNLRSFSMWGKPNVAHPHVSVKAALFDGLSVYFESML
jgi:hypothetical protein